MSATAVTVSYAEAIRRAMAAEMELDETITLLGQDIAIGFPFGVTRDLIERFGPERVRDTPISEAGTMGCAVGAALHGIRTVVEVDFSGFLLLGFDQLVNNAAKLRYMSAGQLRVPLVVRVGQGPLGSFGAQHSQALHGWLANVPGLAVCAPSSAQDAYDLMRWSLRQPDPVVFAEDMRLYRREGELVEHADEVSLGARVVRPGRDATVIAFGNGVSLSLAAADALAADGISLEVLDLRTVAPLDVAAIAASARRTGRVLCMSDDPLLGGFSATLAAVVSEHAGDTLRAPVARLGSRHAPAPYNAELERRIFPSSESVEAAVRGLVEVGA
ncbi:alpha-ketoacid dehydrogenase subunit beta [Conexibacter sp. CPCC 206217]|uniref:alpha-ketoacid dehydrogenase subunit beta n=1 Tax=Conexibacter sp. CPCC 206217 TaxID=3064574 RepID=UPI00271F76E8|nr:transketolase C-terminal domain-containing protein [Conexibacter sp. CPCC 206217]MDO8212676.1 transketolase C-terminal domain-containing protein [Conexibacter sp. CPCC 206217]